MLETRAYPKIGNGAPLRKKVLALAVLASSTLLLAAGSAPWGGECLPGESSVASSVADATATFPKADGSPAGTATFSQAEGGTAVLLRVEGMDESSYGFHIHAMGKRLYWPGSFDQMKFPPHERLGVYPDFRVKRSKGLCIR